MTRAVREAERLVAEGLDAEPLYAALLALLEREGLRFDGACWHVTDPLTGLFTRTGGIGDLPGDYRTALRFELFEDDVAPKMDEVARRSTPVASLVADTGGRPERSLRYREMIAPDGHADELRAVFADAFGRWGSLLMFRGDEPFSERDRELVASVAPVVASALRVGAAIGAAAAPAPGVLVVDARDRLETLDATARALVAGSDDGELPGAVHVAVARARHAGAPVRGRMHTAAGWLLLDASPLDGGRIAVVVQPAPIGSLLDVRLLAAGLTEREREVALCVVRGETTAEIAARLFVSPYTVQDHLKAIFDKTGVRSRRELVASLALELA